MRFEDADCTLYYERIIADTPGVTAPPLLLLHGALGTCEEMRSLVRAFPERERLLIDLPAHGRSGSPLTPLDAGQTSHLLVRLLQTIEVTEVDIVGYSLGGYLGITMGLQSPLHVRSIISHAMKFYWSPEVIQLAVRGLDWNAASQNDRFREKMIGLHTAGGPEQAMRYAGGVISKFSTEQLSEATVKGLQCPLLLSVGDNDELVPLQEILKLYQALGYDHVAMSVLEQTRHAVGTVDPKRFAAATRHFWQANCEAQSEEAPR